MTAIIDGTNGVTTPNVLTSSSGVALTLQSSGTTAVTIDTSQNVGIGVTPSAWGSFKAIQLGGSTYNAIASSNSYMAIFGNTYYDGSNFKYVSTAGASTYIQSGGGHYLSSASSGTAGNTVTLTQVLAVGKSSTLALEGATTQTGTGITFPATQSASSDANTLDDYEEGTWTATDVSGAGLTLTNTTQRYTKIGRLVTLSITDLTWPSTANTSAVEIGGLPFTSSWLGGGAGISNYTGYTLQMIILNSYNAIRLYNTPTGFNRPTNANMSTNSLYFSITYMAT